MIIGSLGSVIFQVGYSQMSTFQNLIRTRVVKIATHNALAGPSPSSFLEKAENLKKKFWDAQSLAGLPRLQHTGRALDTVTMTVMLEQMDTKTDILPDIAISSLLYMAGTGDKIPLVLGIQYLGWWVLNKVEVKHSDMHLGMTLSAEVNLTLTEYN